ncbi:MAG: N-acetylmuramoyl-L-alanine amidase [Elusimicrobia bacterium]|nr:N-acetylmuramoyl-L-alanine amidase [Elusimicrobiota bacterium]
MKSKITNWLRIKNLFFPIFSTVVLFTCLFTCCLYADQLSGKIIVVDPGHAARNSEGKIVNYGCKSSNNTKEIDVVIDISEVIGNMFLNEEATVYFTRDRKSFWRTAKSQDDDNQSRAQFANSRNADVFLRIHCNWAPNKKKRGVSVLWYKDDSKKMAEIVFEEIKKSGVIIDCIRKQHLVGFEFAKVPSILVEYGYLSNVEDEKLLKNKKYLQKVSKAVCAGLEKYYSLNNK